MKRFYKDSDGRWYYDMPKADEIGIPKELLEMVLGADNMLDDLANGNTEVLLNLFTSHEIIPSNDNNVICLTKLEESTINNGCYYVITTNNYTNISLIWLCSVTTVVFGYFPNNIYIQIN